MGKKVVAWELWALALLGLWLKFFHDRTAPTTTAPAPAATGTDWWSAFSSGMSTMLHWLGSLLLLAALVGLSVLAMRLWMRRRRLETMVAEEIILGPDDITNPEEMVSALDQIHTALLTRYGNSAMGQVSWSFEVIRDRDGQIHFVLAAPHRWLLVIEDAWRGVYTNLRFQPWGDVDRTWPVMQHLILERSWQHPTRIDTTYTSSVVEMMVQGLDRAQGEARLQWLLTPLPVGPLTAQLRGSLQQIEYEARAEQQVDPNHPGLGVVGRQDVAQATALLGRSAYRAEVRLAADEWDTMQRVYGAIAGSNADNQWKAQTVWLFRGLWNRWLNHRMPSMAIFGHTILFSKPLATLIHVPSARLRVQSLTRKLVRRGPAPPMIPRDPALAILKDEIGPVGIPEGDRKFNTIFIGSQGGGKSTGMLQQIRVDATWRDRHHQPKALVLIDIGKDTAKRAMGIIPADREVIWFDPADPACPWTLNPLMAGIHADALSNDILEGLTQVFGDDAIRAASREFLGNAILAVKDVHGDAADFQMVYQMLTDPGFRQDVIDRVHEPHQRDYWQTTFTAAIATNPRFVEERLAAPRNKLDEVLRSAAVRAALTSGQGRVQLNLRDIVTGRKVLVANLDKARLGKSGARLLGVFLITMLWHALETQSDLLEDDRVPTALVIDEAQNFISEGFLDILAEGRAYGAQTTLAVRFLGEILSDRAILGVRTLVQNLVIYQFELREEAEDFMKRFMRTYSNMINPSDEAQDNINFGADDFMRLPKHHVVCRWMVDGSPQQAFLAETIPWESAYDESIKQLHLSRQPKLAPAPDPNAWPEAEGTDPAPAVESEPVVSMEGLSEGLSDGFDWNGPGLEVGDGDLPLATEAESEPSSSTESPRATSPPPRWLGWLMDSADRATWWDAETGLGLAPVWERVQQEAGTGVLWQLEGLATMNAGWVPAVRQRAAQVARELTDDETVVAWVDSETLGVWLAPDQALDDAHWLEVGAQRNVPWHRVLQSDTPVSSHEKDEPETIPSQGSEGPTETQRPPIDRIEPQGPPETAAAGPAPRTPTSTTRRTPTKRSTDSDPLTPALWARFVANTKIPEVQVAEWQIATRATDAEVASTVRWILKNHVGEEQAKKVFHKVLQQKLDDRWLDPLCEQLQTTQKAIRDLFIGRTDLKKWAQWVATHPEVSSLKQLTEAVRRVTEGSGSAS